MVRSLAVSRIFEFRVGSGSPNENDLVDTNFWHTLSLLILEILSSSKLRLTRAEELI
jgi:hypothetical protein